MTSAKKGPALPDKARALRELAEKRFIERQAQLPEQLHHLTTVQAQKLLHELRVHQIELEVQNEELHRAQAQLKSSRARYRDLYDQAPVGYLTLDARGQILTANSTAAKMLKVKNETLAGEPLTRFILPEDQDTFYLHRKKLEKGGTQECELRLLSTGSAAFWVRLDSAMWLRDEGSPECRMAVMDITERKLAEAEKQRLMEQLSKKRKEIDDFIYLVIHDLATPLINMRGFCQNLMMDFDELRKVIDPVLKQEEVRNAVEQITGERIPAALDYIAENALKTHRLMDAVLKVSRTGLVETKPETLDANAALKRVLTALRYQVEKEGAEVKTVHLPPCKAAPGTLDHVFNNLISNAVKYRDKTRKLIITVRGVKAAGGKVVYSVSDNGLGIKEADMPKIFQVFYRGNVPGADKGEGVGLSLARTLAEQSGGRIWAESEEGKGAVFFVEMPA